MSKNVKSLNKHLHDALLDISEGDSEESKKLLEASGVDANSIISNSLDKISKYDKALEKRTNSSLVSSVTNKINKLLTAAPLQTNNFLQTYLIQNAPNIQFQAHVPLKRNAISKIKDEIDLCDLAKKLEDKQNELDRK